ncbi:MAG: ROK family transcriptional regulator [Ruminococcaceae bacterium]|nr:ROK family transcriptional regulator [Oscillospiraceae bacterium]
MNKANDVKAINLTAILRSIYKNQPITKSRIADELKLTIATVNNLVTELCNIGICEEDGFVSNGGRRATLYRINRHYGYIISLAVTRNGLVGGIYDLSLRAVDREDVACDISDVMDSTRKIKAFLLEQIGKLNGKRILGIGISVPGRVSEDGIIINIPDYPQWNSVQLKSFLSESISFPIYLDNDTNALLLSAKWNGLVNDCQSFVYLNTDDGLGAGFMLKDKVFYGSNNQACEIGHITIDPNGPICNCGNAGCLQAYVSNTEILRRINSLRGVPVSSLDEAIELYLSGDPAVRSGFSGATAYISLALRNIIMLFDPELIVLQNKWLNLLPDLFNLVQDTVFKTKTDRGSLPIRNHLSILLNRDLHIIETAQACIVFHNIMRNFSA